MTARRRNEVEGYLPSTVDIRHTPYHTTPGRSIYNSRYVGKSARAQVLNMVGGMAAGTLLNVLMFRLAGGEVHTDPRDDNFMQARFKNRTFSLPGSGIYNWIRFASVVGGNKKFVAPKHTNVHPGAFVGLNPRGMSDNAVPTPMTARLKVDRGEKFAAGKLAPGLQAAGKQAFGSDILGQPSYRGRFFDKRGNFTGLNNKRAWTGVGKDIIDDYSPLSVKDMVEPWLDKDPSNAETILATLSLFGINNRPTRFQKDPYYTGKN
jgi:hypothetical protein